MANALSAAGANSKYKLPGAEPAGFLAGLWHGLIAPITFIISIFSPNVRIYETNNKGILYDFGFVIGISGSFGGGARSTR
jgi:hypothetical protein